MLLTCHRIGQRRRATRAASRILRSDGRRCFIAAFVLFGGIVFSGSFPVTLENKSDKLRGFGGRATERPLAACEPFIIFVRREFVKIPNITLIVVIIHPVVYFSANLIKFQSLMLISSFICPKKLSCGALSQQFALRDIDCLSPYRSAHSNTCR